jgi:hypothetical protein
MTDFSPELGASTELDLDGWIDGTCRLSRAAKIYQRGDLITRLDNLQRELEMARKMPADQRSLTDKTPDALADEWEQLAEMLTRTAMTVHVEDRTEERRRHIRERLIKENKLQPEKNLDDSETIILHLVADAITKVEVDGRVQEFPEGFPVNKLRALKDRLGDSAIMDVRDQFFKVISEAPTVTAPLSRSSSSNQGGIT